MPAGAFFVLKKPGFGFGMPAGAFFSQTARILFWRARRGLFFSKSVTPLSYNPLFHEQVLKSIELLRVPSILYAFLQQLRAGTLQHFCPRGGVSPPAHYQIRQNPYR